MAVERHCCRVRRLFGPGWLLWGAGSLDLMLKSVQTIPRRKNYISFIFLIVDFFEQLSPTTEYIKNTYFAKKKSTQIPFHGLRGSSNILDRAREGFHCLLSWQKQDQIEQKKSAVSRAINYHGTQDIIQKWPGQPLQVSPPNEHIQGPTWWTRYQPVSYKMESR